MRLRFPFPPACRGNGNHGNMACACESLFSLPVEEKAVLGCLRSTFPPASRGKGLPRDSAGLRGAGVHMGLRSALKGSVGLRRALWLGIAFPLTGRGKWPSQARLFGVLSKIAFSPTGRGKKVGESQGETPPWRWGFEHVEASGGAFSSTGRGKTAFAARIGR